MWRLSQQRQAKTIIPKLCIAVTVIVTLKAKLQGLCFISTGNLYQPSKNHMIENMDPSKLKCTLCTVYPLMPYVYFLRILLVLVFTSFSRMEQFLTLYTHCTYGYITVHLYLNIPATGAHITFSFLNVKVQLVKTLVTFILQIFCNLY